MAGKVWSFLERARQKRTPADDAKISCSWEAFEKTLLASQSWSSFGKINLATLDQLRTMYEHLYHSVEIGQRALKDAVYTIDILQKQLDAREGEIDMHQDLSERLGQLQEFMDSQKSDGDETVVDSHRGSQKSDGDETMVGSHRGSQKSDGDETMMDSHRGDTTVVVARLQVQLKAAQSQRDGLQAALDEARTEMKRLKDSAEGHVKEPNSSAGSGMVHELQNKLADTQSKLDQSVELFQQLQNESTDTQMRLEQSAQKARQLQHAGEVKSQELIDGLQSQLSAEEEKKASVLQRIVELEAQLQNVNDKYVRAQDNVRELFDECQDLKGNLRVMCRIRPQLDASDSELEPLLTDLGPGTEHLQVIEMAKRNARTAEDVDRFQMERVFEKHDTNQQIFNEVGQLVGSAINGRNVCIFAYGQTGSGKTHTMNYPWNEPNAPAGYVDFGIIPRSVEKISDFINTNQGIWELSISGKYIEIYAEKVYDLLRVETSTVRGKTVSAAPEVKVMYSKDNGVDAFYADSTEVDLTGDGDFEEKVRGLLAQASSNRRTRSTKGNAQSSRSHSLLTLQISARRVDGKGKQKTIGLLNLIDLAGSEEPDINDKASQQEGININLSLSELRKVLGQMADPKVKNISFRGSVLTKLLQTSLGTGCKTMMFVMLSPLKKDSKDTRSTLQFAMTAQQAKLKTSKAPPR
ncbi:hypothetical protein TruAng_011410 [Truncatella angustata]|nr:hypothetical protein TruAng_011410 [Truncatella angustata]